MSCPVLSTHFLKNRRLFGPWTCNRIYHYGNSAYYSVWVWNLVCHKMAETQAKAYICFQERGSKRTTDKIVCWVAAFFMAYLSPNIRVIKSMTGVWHLWAKLKCVWVLVWKTEGKKRLGKQGHRSEVARMNAKGASWPVCSGWISCKTETIAWLLWTR